MKSPLANTKKSLLPGLVALFFPWQTLKKSLARVVQHEPAPSKRRNYPLPGTYAKKTSINHGRPQSTMGFINQPSDNEIHTLSHTKKYNGIVYTMQTTLMGNQNSQSKEKNK